jgi:SUMO ligase MMS21 Smc5/6 complex component
LNECSICLEVNNNQIIKTACNHEFHEKCLFEWMKISMTCPICRGGI